MKKKNGLGKAIVWGAAAAAAGVAAKKADSEAWQARRI